VIHELLLHGNRVTIYTETTFSLIIQERNKGYIR